MPSITLCSLLGNDCRGIRTIHTYRTKSTRNPGLKRTIFKFENATTTAQHDHRQRLHNNPTPNPCVPSERGEIVFPSHTQVRLVSQREVGRQVSKAATTQERRPPARGGRQAAFASAWRILRPYTSVIQPLITPFSASRYVVNRIWGHAGTTVSRHSS